MSEAEKKWIERGDKDCKSFIHGICDTYRMGREAYKAALRREIESELLEVKSHRDKVTDDAARAIFESSVITYQEIIKLLDTVEP